MDLVVYLENKIKMTDKEDIIDEEETGDAPITNQEFHAAIGALSTKLDKLMESTRDILKEANA
eukprot:3107422-Heterocapsa_arctica.AAC.1